MVAPPVGASRRGGTALDSLRCFRDTRCFCDTWGTRRAGVVLKRGLKRGAQAGALGGLNRPGKGIHRSAVLRVRKFHAFNGITSASSHASKIHASYHVGAKNDPSETRINIEFLIRFLISLRHFAVPSGGLHGA